MPNRTRLRLFERPPSQLTDYELPLPRREACTRCARHTPTKSVCMAAEGEPSGLLAVGGWPSSVADRAGRPFISQHAASIRRAVKSHWDGPAAWTYATLCAGEVNPKTGKADPKPGEVKACRRFLAQTISEVRPQRILTFGKWALYGFTGRLTDVFTARRGFSWTQDRTPLFILPDPADLADDYFGKQKFQEDIRWALTTDPAVLEEEFPFDATVQLVRTEAHVAEALAELRAARWVAYDHETYGELYNKDFELLLCTVADVDGDDVWGWDRTSLRDPVLRQGLIDVLTDPEIGKVAHFGTFDAHATWCSLGVEVAGIHGDTRLWAKILDVEADGHLKVLQDRVGFGGGKSELDVALNKALQKARRPKKPTQALDLFADDLRARAAREVRDGRGRLKPKAYGFALVQPSLLARYGATDTRSTANLGKQLEVQIMKRPEPRLVWEELIKPLSWALEQIERRGLLIDQEMLADATVVAEARCKRREERIRSLYGINPNANQEVANLLFKRAELPIVRMGDDGPSVDADVLEKLRGQHPLIDDLLPYREDIRVLGTYLHGWARMLRDDGRIHSTYLPDGAVTGRLASTQPNLQNVIKARTYWGRILRSLIIVPEDYRLVAVDESQAEIRVAAERCQDPEMLTAIRGGLDYHWHVTRMVAPIVWKIPPEEATSDHRERIKATVFAMLYGGGPYGLAQRLNITVEEAETIVEAILSMLPGYAKWGRQQEKDCYRDGGVWTYWLGQRARWRPIPTIRSKDEKKQRSAQRLAKNTPIQAEASDLCGAGLVRIVKRCREEGLRAYPNNIVHDEILSEVHEDDVPRYVQIAREAMTDFPLSVPLKTDAEVGVNWAMLEKYND